MNLHSRDKPQILSYLYIKLHEKLRTELLPGLFIALQFFLVLRLGYLLFTIARPSSVGVPLVFSLSNVDHMLGWKQENIQVKAKMHSVK
jgi:hypothetical protein